MLGSLRGETVTTVDVLEGLTAVIAIRMDQPKFDGQTKKLLQSSEAGRAVREFVENALGSRLDKDEDLARRIVERALDATRARLAARLAGRTARIQRREIAVDYEVYKRQFGIRSKTWHDSCTWLTDEGLLGQHAELCDVAGGRAPAGRLLRQRRRGRRLPRQGRGEGRAGHHAGDGASRPDPRSTTSRTAPSMTCRSTDELVRHRRQPRGPPPAAAARRNRCREIFRVLRPGGQFIVGQTMPYADVDALLDVPHLQEEAAAAVPDVP